LNSEAGLILSPPNLPGWDSVPIATFLSDRLGIPARLMNDANAGALAELRFGAGRGSKNLIFLTFGTGLGAGIVANGALVQGAGDGAGEVGHIRLSDWGPVGYGKAGSFEGFCSGTGIVQLTETFLAEEVQRGAARSALHTRRGPKLSARDVVEASRDGDELAIRVVGTVGEYLGRGVSVLVDILNPEKIVIGGIFARAADLLQEPMNAALTREALPGNRTRCAVVPAELGDRIGDYAAVCAAMEAL
jgi:glucokinase